MLESLPELTSADPRDAEEGSIAGCEIGAKER